MGDMEHIVDEFRVGELVLVAEAVGLAPVARWGSRKLVDAIRARLRVAGIPTKLDKNADLVEDFLYVDGHVDEKGNPQEGVGGYPPIDEFLAQNDISKLPDCFGFADDADPACKKCSLYAYCAEERIQNLPPCFALLFSGSEAECIECIDAPFCKGD